MGEKLEIIVRYCPEYDGYQATTTVIDTAGFGYDPDEAIEDLEDDLDFEAELYYGSHLFCEPWWATAERDIKIEE